MIWVSEQNIFYSKYDYLRRCYQFNSKNEYIWQRVHNSGTQSTYIYTTLYMLRDNYERYSYTDRIYTIMFK